MKKVNANLKKEGKRKTCFGRLIKTTPFDSISESQQIKTKQTIKLLQNENNSIRQFIKK